MPLPVIEIQWRDNNGKVSETRLRRGQLDTLTSAVSAGNEAVAVLSTITNAVCTGYTVRWPFTVADPGEPDLESDVKRLLLLFYGNDNGAATLAVPSPRPLSVDMVGPYRNVRLVLEAPDVSPLLTSLGGSLAGTVTPWGDAWPMPLLAGGLTRYGGT